MPAPLEKGGLVEHTGVSFPRTLFNRLLRFTEDAQRRLNKLEKRPTLSRSAVIATAVEEFLEREARRKYPRDWAKKRTSGDKDKAQKLRSKKKPATSFE